MSVSVRFVRETNCGLRRKFSPIARAAAQTKPGWSLRVISNKFPVLRVEGALTRKAEGLYDKMNGVGAHEVIIESPDHFETLADHAGEASGRSFLGVS